MNVNPVKTAAKKPDAPGPSEHVRGGAAHVKVGLALKKPPKPAQSTGPLVKLGSSNPKAGLPMPRVVVSQMLSFLQPGDIARFAAVSKQTHALASAVPGVHSRAVVQNYIDLNANHDKAWRKSNNASFAAHVIGLTVIGLPFSIAMVRHFDRKVSAAQEQLATAWRPRKEPA